MGRSVARSLIKCPPRLRWSVSKCLHRLPASELITATFQLFTEKTTFRETGGMDRVGTYGTRIPRYGGITRMGQSGGRVVGVDFLVSSSIHSKPTASQQHLYTKPAPQPPSRPHLIPEPLPSRQGAANVVCSQAGSLFSLSRSSNYSLSQQTIHTTSPLDLSLISVIF